MDSAIQTLKIDKTDDSLSTGRQQVVKFLRNYKGAENSAELRRRNTAFHDDSDEGDSSGESTPSALKRFNEKLKKKEMERLQRMNGTVCEESSPEDIDEIHPKKTNKGLMREDDDSQENQREVILSFPSSSSTQFQNYSGNHIENQSTGLWIDSSVDDMVPSDVAETFSDASDYEENDNGDVDSTYSSMDEGNNGIEMVDWNDQDSVITGATLVDPVARSSSHLSGRVPSLVTQKTADWLVNDMGPRTAKRKRPPKQAKLPGSLQQRKRINHATITRPKHGLSPGVSQKMPCAKQSTLAVSKEARTHQNSIHVPSVNVSTPVPSRPEAVSTISGANSGLTISATSPRHIVAPGGTPPMRLRVQVQGKVFLIPCPQGRAQEVKNIGWLAEQVSENVDGNCCL